MTSFKKYLVFTLTVAGVITFLACNKDKVTSNPTVVNVSFWDQVAGEYKVYDTLGNYVYAMQIIHIKVNEYIDSLRFENFDGEFTFTTLQSHPNNYPNYVAIGVHDTLYDSDNKRWKLGGASYFDYNNLSNDTIRLRFQKTNINYWMYDLVPYYACDCKQIAVKQH